MKRQLPLREKRELLPTRADILVRADELIRRRGFNAFSYTDIAAILEIRNAAVHYHFPTKSELGQAVIDREIERLTLYRRDCGATPGDEQLKHLVTAFYHNSQRNYICLMGSLLPDFATFDSEMRTKVAALCDAILGWLTESLESARAAGRLRFEGRPRERAALVASTLLSSLLLSRVSGERVFQQMVDRMLEDLGAGWRTCDLPELEWPFPESHSFT
ncbi:MAG TPA: TetR/AcrR family transcriptional regulator [Puia sp.]|nr:TetR/AcrR family transcriptional regulator [Puia sp.]